jgi:hypothetical protein
MPIRILSFIGFHLRDDYITVLQESLEGKLLSREIIFWIGSMLKSRYEEKRHA